MYSPDKEKLGRYVHGDGESRSFDWHAWLRDLSPADKEELGSEVLSAGSRKELSDYARQYYLHFCNETEDAGLRRIEHDFVSAQIEDRTPEEIDSYEDMYFKRAQELLRLQESKEHED
jgi:hypothetical protein